MINSKKKIFDIQLENHCICTIQRENRSANKRGSNISLNEKMCIAIYNHSFQILKNQDEDQGDHWDSNDPGNYGLLN